MYGVLQNSMGVIRSCVSLEFPGPFSDRPGELLQLLAVALVRCHALPLRELASARSLSVAFPNVGMVGRRRGGISNRGAGCSAPSRVLLSSASNTLPAHARIMCSLPDIPC